MGVIVNMQTCMVQFLDVFLRVSQLILDVDYDFQTTSFILIAFLLPVLSIELMIGENTAGFLELSDKSFYPDIGLIGHLEGENKNPLSFTNDSISPEKLSPSEYHSKIRSEGFT
jgi:hypothetical protein